MVKHVLFDFFGTLVDYNENAVDTVPTSAFDLLCQWQPALVQTELPHLIDAAYDPLEAEANTSLREYHTHEAMAALLTSLGITASDARIEQVAECWIADWSATVQPPEQLQRALHALPAPASIVSNTSTPWLVPECLARFDLTHHFEHVITSVELGFRKPHASIYEAALAAARTTAGDALFVGDNPICDYLGPREHGIDAVWISTTPDERIPETDRISSVVDLPQWLAQRQQ